MSPRYPLARSDPSTATPSAPPATRVVSLIAEPTLILAAGSEPMIASVAGAIAERHAEAEQHQRARDQAVARCRVGQREQPQRDRDHRRARRARRTRIPSRSVSLADSGPPTTRPSGDRHRPQAGLERRVAAHLLQVLREEEDRPEQREERERDRGARGAEARVAEQREVEHRRRRAPLPGHEARRASPPRTRTRRASTASVQPRDGASIRPQTSALSAAKDSTKPPRSSRGADSSRLSGTRKRPAISATIDDRQVDEEDPAPVGVLDQPAAGHRADRDPDARRRRPRSRSPCRARARGTSRSGSTASTA